MILASNDLLDSSPAHSVPILKHVTPSLRLNPCSYSPSQPMIQTSAVSTLIRAGHHAPERILLLRFNSFAALSLCLVLTGCALTPTAAPTPAAGLTIAGNVHGGQQPIAGAHIYLLAAGTTGYGSASTSLLTSGTDGTDPTDGTHSIGGYVLTHADGSFHISGNLRLHPQHPGLHLRPRRRPRGRPQPRSRPHSSSRQLPRLRKFRLRHPLHLDQRSLHRRRRIRLLSLRHRRHRRRLLQHRTRPDRHRQRLRQRHQPR